MPCKPGVTGSIPDFTSLSDETLSRGPVPNDLSCWWDVKQVWGISETRDQNYRSNARPRLRSADLLTEEVILQLRQGERNLMIGLSFWPVSADLIDLFSDAFEPRGEKLNGKQTKFSGKNHQIEPSFDRNLKYFFLTFFTSILSLICGRGSDG